MLALLGTSRAGAAPAELVLTNGTLLTADADDSLAKAVAIAGGRIVAVGSTGTWGATPMPCQPRR